MKAPVAMKTAVAMNKELAPVWSTPEWRRPGMQLRDHLNPRDTFNLRTTEIEPITSIVLLCDQFMIRGEEATAT